MNTPAQGIVSIATPPAPAQSKNVAPTPQPIDGTYASFVLPSSFTAARLEPSPYPTVETFGYEYRQTGTPAWVAYVSINDVSHNNGQSTSYQLRASKPDQYTQSTQTVSGNTYKIMTDVARDQFAKVAYTAHGNYVADISLEGGDSTQQKQLQAVFEEILASWQWK